MHQNESGSIDTMLFMKLHVCLECWYKDSPYDVHS